jgi:hypothetical protein
MKEIGLTLAIGAGTPEEFDCHVGQAILEAKAGDVVTYTTLCANGSMSRSGNPTYTLHLVGVQDWDGTAGSIGLARFLDDHVGEVAEFVFQAHGLGVAPSPATPAKSGSCELQAPSYGGEADKWAEFDVSLPITGAPVTLVA